MLNVSSILSDLNAELLGLTSDLSAESSEVLDLLKFLIYP
jgi:hypothetical protein